MSDRVYRLAVSLDVLGVTYGLPGPQTLIVKVAGVTYDCHLQEFHSQLDRRWEAMLHTALFTRVSYDNWVTSLLLGLFFARGMASFFSFLFLNPPVSFVVEFPQPAGQVLWTMCYNHMHLLVGVEF